MRGATDRRGLVFGIGAFSLAGAGVSYAEVQRMGSMEAYAASVLATRRALASRPDVGDLIRFATLAPNGHNSQPWRFQVTDQQISILPDFTRRTPVVDPDDHHVFVSLGAAAENLSLAGAARGRGGTTRFDPAADGSVVFSFDSGHTAEPDLFDAIAHRQSTRADYDGRAVSSGDLRALAKAAETPGVDLVLITDRRLMERALDLVLTGNSAQLGDPAFLTELKHWIRFSPRQAQATGDGLFAAASGNPVTPDWLGPALMSMVLRADTDNDRYARQIRSSAGLAVFVSEHADKAHWVASGRACQRFALRATALGMKVAFVNQPVEVARLRPELADMIGLPGRRPDLVMRFGYGTTLPFSARRPVAAVLA